VMLMQMISGGALGGGISSAIARALGGRQQDKADALVLHALVINLLLGAVFSLLMLVFGRRLYAAMGGEGAALEAALVYSNIVFLGNPVLWLMNGLASAVRGTGNMLVPALVICLGVALLVPLSPLLIFGLGPLPGLGMAGGGAALVVFYVTGASVLGWYVVSGRNLARLRWARLEWRMAAEILRVGAAAAISSVQTNVTIAALTALVSAKAGLEAVAGFGTGARLEYLLVPLAFGLGAPLVAMVGTNIGAGQTERALRIALTGGALAFALTGSVGLAAALWPEAWLGLFSSDPAVVETGALYLRLVGPAYGFFGLGMSLYFASQGAGRLAWPLAFGFLRMCVAVLGGWLMLWLTGSLAGLFLMAALGMFLHGTTLLYAVQAGVWFGKGRRLSPLPAKP